VIHHSSTKQAADYAIGHPPSVWYWFASPTLATTKPATGTITFDLDQSAANGFDIGDLP
jgi:hypothetical protein